MSTHPAPQFVTVFNVEVRSDPFASDEDYFEEPPPPQDYDAMKSYDSVEDDDSWRWTGASVVPAQFAQLIPEAMVTPTMDPAPNHQTSTEDLPLPPPPRMLEPMKSITTPCKRYVWKVDAKKLTRNEKHAVSDNLIVDFGGKEAECKLMIFPKRCKDKPDGISFKTAGGKGYIQFKCLDLLDKDIADVSYRFFIGSGDKKQKPRGPVNHNFSVHAVTGLPEEEEEWDFTQAVEKNKSTFDVVLELITSY